MPANITSSSGRSFLTSDQSQRLFYTCQLMCLYTYHHYPVCGHISNWSVTSCLEFSNFVRQLAGTGHTVSCKEIEITHDLLPTTQPNLCFQCELEWSENIMSDNRQVLDPKPYLNIEGLGAKSPLIEFEARMPVDVRNMSASNRYTKLTDNDQYDIFADTPFREPEMKPRRARCPCDGKGPCSLTPQVDQSTQTEVSAVDNRGIMLMSNPFQQSWLEDGDDDDSRECPISEVPDNSFQALQNELITDICQALKTAKVTEAPRESFSARQKGASTNHRTLPELSSKSAHTPSRPISSDMSSSRRYDLPNDELPIFMSHSPYDWIPHLDIAPDFLAGEQGAERRADGPKIENGEDARTSRCASAYSNPSASPSPPVRNLKPVAGRKCTPYARPQPRFDRFKLMPRENHTNGLGMSLPQNIESYLEHIFRSRRH